MLDEVPVALDLPRCRRQRRAADAEDRTAWWLPTSWRTPSRKRMTVYRKRAMERYPGAGRPGNRTSSRPGAGEVLLRSGPGVRQRGGGGPQVRRPAEVPAPARPAPGARADGFPCRSLLQGRGLGRDQGEPGPGDLRRPGEPLRAAGQAALRLTRRSSPSTRQLWRGGWLPHEGCTHLRDNGYACRTVKPDWMLCDMIVRPLAAGAARTLAERRALPRLRGQRQVPRQGSDDHPRRRGPAARAVGLTRLRVRHLFTTTQRDHAHLALASPTGDAGVPRGS